MWLHIYLVALGSRSIKFVSFVFQKILYEIRNVEKEL